MNTIKITNLDRLFLGLLVITCICLVAMRVPVIRDFVMAAKIKTNEAAWSLLSGVRGAEKYPVFISFNQDVFDNGKITLLNVAPKYKAGVMLPPGRLIIKYSILERVDGKAVFVDHKANLEIKRMSNHFRILSSGEVE